MILAVSSDTRSNNKDLLKLLAREKLTVLKPTKVLTDLSLGWCQVVAETCVELGIPFKAYLPFKDLGRLWSKEQEAYLKELISLAEEVEIVTKERSSGKTYFWVEEAIKAQTLKMIKDADELLAVCLPNSFPRVGMWGARKAAELNKKVYRINPDDRFKPSFYVKDFNRGVTGNLILMGVLPELLRKTDIISPPRTEVVVSGYTIHVTVRPKDPGITTSYTVLMYPNQGLNIRSHRSSVPEKGLFRCT